MIRYTAKAGEFIGGLPACDLTDAEWASLPEELRALALALGLYQADQPEPEPALGSPPRRTRKDKTE